MIKEVLSPLELKVNNHLDLISRSEIEDIVNEVTKKTGVDFSPLPISIANPGDALYTFLEAQIKLQALGLWEEAAQLLINQSSDGSIVINDETSRNISIFATDQGINLDGNLPGFAYNLGGASIVYLNPPISNVDDLARSYSKKESVPYELIASNPQEFLKDLAKKYLPHEIGHSVERLFFTPQEQLDWAEIVMRDYNLVKKVIEIQQEKYPTIESIRVPEEAFADLFAAEYVYGRGNSRLGSFPGVEKVMLNILKNKGFIVNE